MIVSLLLFCMSQLWYLASHIIPSFKNDSVAINVSVSREMRCKWDRIESRLTYSQLINQLLCTIDCLWSKKKFDESIESIVKVDAIKNGLRFESISISRKNLFRYLTLTLAYDSSNFFLNAKLKEERCVPSQ